VNYLLNLFSPETHAAFSASDQSVSGFRARHRTAAARVESGDVLVCYVTRVSRWVGMLRVEGAPFEDSTPRFTPADDPFLVRFKVQAIVWLSPDRGIPIHDPDVWSHLSITREHDSSSTTWTGAVRTSLAKLSRDDGSFLDGLLRGQATHPKEYPLSPEDLRALQPHTMRTGQGAIVVSVPEDRAEATSLPTPPEARESIKVQALVALLGSQMGFRVWVPAGDRAAIVKEAPEVEPSLLSALPLNYDATTLRTIENIDVLWMKGRSMARAFEIEHTTAIYSGILRMADLLALQPNMDIRLHIVAPVARREKVFEEIRRPVFSVLEGKPLAERCTFLSYESIREVAGLKHVVHLADTVLEEYQEEAEA
jgi:hypothetical protein